MAISTKARSHKAVPAFKQKDEAGLYKIFQEVVNSGSEFPYECNSLQDFYRQFFSSQGQVYVCRTP